MPLYSRYMIAVNSKIALNAYPTRVIWPRLRPAHSTTRVNMQPTTHAQRLFFYASQQIVVCGQNGANTTHGRIKLHEAVLKRTITTLPPSRTWAQAMFHLPFPRYGSSTIAVPTAGINDTAHYQSAAEYITGSRSPQENWVCDHEDERQEPHAASHILLL